MRNLTFELLFLPLPSFKVVITVKVLQYMVYWVDCKPSNIDWRGGGGGVVKLPQLVA